MGKQVGARFRACAGAVVCVLAPSCVIASDWVSVSVCPDFASRCSGTVVSWGYIACRVCMWARACIMCVCRNRGVRMLG